MTRAVILTQDEIEYIIYALEREYLYDGDDSQESYGIVLSLVHRLRYGN